MATYTVKNNEGRTVKFRWDSPNLPTEQDMQEVFESSLNAEKTGTGFLQAPEGEMKLEQDRPIRQAISNTVRPMLETGGLVAGGTLASPGVATTPIGAGIGYAAGKKTADILDELMGVKKPESLKENIVGSVKDVAEGATFEMGGQSTAKIIEKIASPMASRMTASAKLAEQEAKDVGVTLKPGETTGSKTQQLFESLMSKTPFASSVDQEWVLKNQLDPLIKARNKFIQTGKGSANAEQVGFKIKEAIDKHVASFAGKKTETVNAMKNSLLKRLGSEEGYETLGKEVQDVLADKSLATVIKKNKAYNDIAKEMPEGELNFKSFEKESKEILDKISKLPNQSSKLKNILNVGVNQSPETAAMLKQIEQYPEKVQQSIAKEMGLDLSGGAAPKDWPTMQGIRSQLSEFIKGEDLSVKMNAPHLKGQLSNEGRLYKRLKSAIDNDFERLAKEAGSGAFEKMQIANAFYTNEFAPVWKTKLIQKMAYTSPEKVVDVAFKPGGITEVKLAKKALGEKEFGTLKRLFTNKLLGEGKTDVFDPKGLQTQLNKYGDEMLSEVYASNEVEALKSLASNGTMLLDKKLPGSGILRSIASNTPNTVIDSIVGSAEKFPGSKRVLENITLLKQFLPKSEQEGLKRAFSERLFKINQTTNMVQPIQLSKTIKTYDKVLHKFYKPEEIEFLRKISRTGQRMALAEANAANPSGTAQNVIAWTVFGAVLIAPVNELMKGNLGDTAKTAATGVVSAVLLPKYLSKIVLSPAGRKYFTKGMMTKASTKKGIELATKIIASISSSEQSEKLGNNLTTNKKESNNAAKR